MAVKTKKGKSRIKKRKNMKGLMACCRQFKNKNVVESMDIINK
jgi:hypothetical protein